MLAGDTSRMADGLVRREQTCVGPLIVTAAPLRREVGGAGRAQRDTDQWQCNRAPRRKLSRGRARCNALGSGYLLRDRGRCPTSFATCLIIRRAERCAFSREIDSLVDIRFIQIESGMLIF